MSSYGALDDGPPTYRKKKGKKSGDLAYDETNPYGGGNGAQRSHGRSQRGQESGGGDGTYEGEGTMLNVPSGRGHRPTMEAHSILDSLKKGKDESWFWYIMSLITFAKHFQYMCVIDLQCKHFSTLHVYIQP